MGENFLSSVFLQGSNLMRRIEMCYGGSTEISDKNNGARNENKNGAVYSGPTGLPKATPDEISRVLENQINSYSPNVKVEHVGIVLQVGDGIARIYGLQNVMAGELLLFD